MSCNLHLLTSTLEHLKILQTTIESLFSVYASPIMHHNDSPRKLKLLSKGKVHRFHLELLDIFLSFFNDPIDYNDFNVCKLMSMRSWSALSFVASIESVVGWKWNFWNFLHPVVGLPLSLVTFASHSASYVKLRADPHIKGSDVALAC